MQPEALSSFPLLEKLVRSKLTITHKIQYELDLLSEAPEFLVKAFLQAYQYIILEGNKPAHINECHSLIAYELGLTTAHPGKVSFHYYVEAGSLPDIDTDYANPDQVKAYLREKYGHDRVISIPTFSKYKVKSLLKDLCRVITDEDGKTLVSLEEINALTKKLPLKIDAQISEDMSDDDDSHEDMSMDEILSNKDLKEFGKKYPEIFRHFLNLYGKPRHTGVHAAGIILTPESAKNITPLAQTKKVITASFSEAGSVAQLGSLGFVKIDVLGLRTLKILETCNEIVMGRYEIDENTPSPCMCFKQNKECRTNYKLPLMVREGIGKKIIDLDKVCLNVPKVYTAIGNFQTEGVFQFESSGLTGFTHKYNPNTFMDLAYITSLYRPGPLDARLDKHGIPVDPEDSEFANSLSAAFNFIERRKGTLPVVYPSEKVRPILESTYGITTYQEQISRMIMAMTNCSFPDAEKVRKFLTKVKPELVKTDPDTIEKINKFYFKFKEDSLKNNCTQKEIDAVWNLILPFARYGFNCVSGDTLLERPGANQYQANPIISIKELYEAQESKTDWGKKLRGGRSSLLQMDDDNIIRPAKLKRIHFNGTKEIFHLQTETGESIKATKEHLFYSGSEYVELQNLTVGDDIAVKDSTGESIGIKLTKITSIVSAGLEEVYDLEMLSDNHNFLTNNFISHNCSHAVAYSLISYQTGFFRTLFPKEYLTSLMYHNLGDDKIISYVRTAQKLNFKIITPNINTSLTNFHIDSDGNINAGLSMIKGVGDKATDSIIENRNTFGVFTSIEDFLSRNINWRVATIKVLKLLVDAGAFDDISPNRHLTWTKIQISKGKIKASTIPTIEITNPETNETTKELYVEDYSEKEKLKLERTAFGFLFNDKVTKNKETVQNYKNILDQLSRQKKKSASIGTIDEIKIMKQKNGKDYARISATNHLGDKEQWLIFAHVWEFVSSRVENGEAYCVLGKLDNKTILVDTIVTLDNILDLKS